MTAGLYSMHKGCVLWGRAHSIALVQACSVRLPQACVAASEDSSGLGARTGLGCLYVLFLFLFYSYEDTQVHIGCRAVRVYSDLIVLSL